MSDFAKLQVSAFYADNSDFNPILAKFEPAAYESTPDEYRRDRVDAETGGTTLTTSYLTSIDYLGIKNMGANNVTIGFQNAASVTQSQVLAPGKECVLPDVRAAANVTLTSVSTTCPCDIFLIGT